MLHIVLFFVVLIALTVLAPQKSSNHDVWALFVNEGGYESKGLSFFVGLITPVFSFTGADGAVHMCEEIKHASTNLPNALLGLRSLPIAFKLYTNITRLHRH